jgi:transposase
MNQKPQRNWSQYNQKLKNQARIEFFISEDCISQWSYTGERRPGGKCLYADQAIEACLLIREAFGMALRQTEGFVQSLFDLLKINLQAPNYTTLSRRCGKLKPQMVKVDPSGGLVVAIDSTGLSLYSASAWNRKKHADGKQPKGNHRWRKLHIMIDTSTGLILAAEYSEATDQDGLHLPTLLNAVEGPIDAVAGDMAYDTGRCRKAIHDRGARQLIPPKKNARVAKDSSKLRRLKDCLQERDDAILFFQHNAINGDTSLAKARWKELVGYHVRSRAETPFSQIKTHSSDRLTNKTEKNRKTQALLKCVLINKMIQQTA